MVSRAGQEAGKGLGDKEGARVMGRHNSRGQLSQWTQALSGLNTP